MHKNTSGFEVILLSNLAAKILLPNQIAGFQVFVRAQCL